MNKSGIFIIGLLLLFCKNTIAQVPSSNHPRIAFFVPLYLDSAFDASGKYKWGKTMPRYINAGLEFYNGANIALDSLNNEGVQLNVQVYDAKNAKQSIYHIADSGALDSTDAIIGAVSGKEYLDLATIAKEKKIPFISATYPNDGGISENPYVIIVNSKLNTHLQVLYNYMLRNFGTHKLVMFRRQNGADDRVTEVFKSLNTSAAGEVLNIKTVVLNNVFSAEDIASSLDGDRENIIICGSLDDNFARNIISNAASLITKYKITLVGMPTWEDYTDLTRPELRELSIIYSSSFFNPGQENNWVKDFTQQYGRNAYVTPTETAFRGFEITYLFAHLLQDGKSNLTSHLNDTTHTILTNFDFKPVYKSKSSKIPDYYENKRVFIVKQWNDELTRLN
ncbi:MAG: amino acid ABC transporter substrate-binding protein [Terrimonas sp.]|nr:amino acid ABC transporter substrate-binding protein [Terrimonas sp.]OJY81341.1 MAG: hypothetical protein BGP13_15180 [Sphingobacteriales bacterium 40-81]